LGAKTKGGDASFNKKPIPPPLAVPYRKLLALAAHELPKGHYEETAAAWELLDRFHGRRAAAGGRRFDDITRALAAGLAGLAAGFDYRTDGRLGHLLLDEFQDTSTGQWAVLRPLAGRAMAGGTFFGVGDVKQAIYGWRGGRAALLDRLPAELGIAAVLDMDESRRSAQSVVDVANRVFPTLARFVEKAAGITGGSPGGSRPSRGRSRRRPSASCAGGTTPSGG